MVVFILENLLGLLETNQANDNAPEIMKELKEMKTIYDNLKMTEATGEVKTDEAAQKTTIGSKGELSLTPEQLAEITKKITKLRTLIIS